MTGEKRILDNRRGTVGDFLRAALREADVFRAVTAYFSVNGFDLLSGELRGVKDSRFLFGDPSSAAEVDKDGRVRAFRMNEGKLELRDALRQKPLALACAEWIRGGAKIRSVRHGFLHGKMYIADSNSKQGGGAVLGSSNFTQGGLSNNLEINLAVNDEPTRAEMREWFDKWWADGENTKDVTDEVLKALERMGAENTPKFVYYKTLFEIFRRQIDERDESAREMPKNLLDTKIWKKLYGFQREGARHIIDRLRRMDGCILADSVGLGKTYTALAVIKYFELKHNARVLVLCPKKLGDNWKLYSSRFLHRQNPFADDDLDYAVLSHTDLSRDGGESNGIDLASINWSRFNLVVIDESHNFRNASASRRDENGKIIRYSRYERLLEDIVKKGGKTKVLMLSATPVNTSLEDLRNQVDIMTGKDRAALLEPLGVGDFHSLLKKAQKTFKAWEEDGEKDKAKLMDSLDGDFFALLGGVSISRSRRHVRKFYSEQIKTHGDFPKQEKPEERQPTTDSRGKLSYEQLRERILKFTLSIYTPSGFLDSEEKKKELEREKKKRNFNQKDRERFLIGMILMNFLKRLESSAHSLELTLARTVKKIDDMLVKIDAFRAAPKKHASAELDLPDEDEEDDEFHIGQGFRRYHLKDMDLNEWQAALKHDRAILESARAAVAEVTAEHDGKLAQLKEDIRKRAANPTTDKDGKQTRKMLVFTAFKDTATYLYDNLADLAKEEGMNIAIVAGDHTQTTTGENNFNGILDNFAPRARERQAALINEGEIDILIATDCISEGQNLQDCDTVLNYDIHWNPVRLVQRFGRVDRIGSRHRSARAIHYWPTADMEEYLKLRTRVEARMALVDTVTTGDSSLPNQNEAEESEQLLLDFRDNQLRQLRGTPIDLEDIAGGMAINEFTLDDFLAQLMDYLTSHREELESAPDGLYAVVGETDDRTQAGVIFFLRAPEYSGDKREMHASPIRPMNAVYVRDDGEVRVKCANPKEALDIFRAAAANEKETLAKFCDKFNDKTRNGGDMSHYDKLIREADNHIREADKLKRLGIINPQGDPAARIPKRNRSRDGAALELVTWLVIMPRQ